jgi:DNA-binding XRE family transcriptional regulator
MRRRGTSPGQAVRLPRYRQAAALVRDQVANGVLAPGAAAPSGAALARMTGYSVLTCRRALRALIEDGVLVEGASPAARPRVPGGRGAQTAEDAGRALSRTLSGYRRAAGLTQPQFAGLVGLSVTAVGHAETGRVWQARPFWERADKILNAGGELLGLHDAFQAARVPPKPAVGTEGSPPRAMSVGLPPAVAAGVPGLVACVTVTWADGGVTTAYPPGMPKAR